jgi:hypothetical protein
MGGVTGFGAFARARSACGGARWRRVLAPAFALLAAALATTFAAPAAQAAPLVRIGLPLANEADPYARPVGRMLTLLASYTHWPEPHDPLRLCLVEPTDHAEALDSPAFAGEAGIATTVVTAQAVIGTQCEIVYIGRMSIGQQRSITTAFRDKPTLTVAENDPACRSRAMICLLFEADSLSFRLNIDAVSRSQVRIDPRVLRMGMARGGGW